MGAFGDFMLGSESSGTSLETQGLATDLAKFFQTGLAEGGGGRLGAQGIADTFGIDIADLGLQDSIEQLLSPTGGSNTLQAFQAAQQPERNRAVNSARTNLAQQFGTAGGRHSRNLGGASATADAQFADTFGAQDFEFFNQGRQTDIAALANVLQSLPSLQQASLMPLQLAGNFANPQAPVFNEGALGDILSTGASVFSTLSGGAQFEQLMKILNGGAPSPTTAPHSGVTRTRFDEG